MAEVQNYPIPTYRYRVTIDNQDTITFSEVSGLDVSYETITFKESLLSDQTGQAGPNIYYLQGQRQPVNISLKKGILRKESKEQLDDWFQQHYNNQRLYKKDVVIDLMDEVGDVVVSWKVANAFPTKLSAPTFNADGNDVAVETMELMADWVTMTQGVS